MTDQTVLGPTLREALRKRRDEYLLRLTRWERSAATNEGVVEVRRRFAGSGEAPPEAPFETEERARLEKRYGDDVTGYGDLEALRVVRNELNLNRLLAWLLWLKEESARDAKVLDGARNPFRTELLPGEDAAVFGVLPAQAHLPPLDQAVGLPGVLTVLRKCGASVSNESLAAVFQQMAGVQTFKIKPITPTSSDEAQGLMPVDGMIEDFKQLVKRWEKDQKRPAPALTEPTLAQRIATCLQAAKPGDPALFASGQGFSGEDAVRDAVDAAWGEDAWDVLGNLSVTLTPASIGWLLDWLTRIHAAALEPSTQSDANPTRAGWEQPPHAGWDPPLHAGWDRAPVSGWEPPPRAGWDPPPARIAPDRLPAWRQAARSIAAIAALERFHRLSLSDGIRELALLILVGFGWPEDTVRRWLDYARDHAGYPLRTAALLEFPGIYAEHIDGAPQFQFPPYSPLGVRWNSAVLLPSTIGHILALKDTADFHTTDHLRFVYLFDAGKLMNDPAVLPAEVRPFFEAALLRFKYWLEDAHSRAAEEMTFWSENHQVLFASCEFLAGQRWPDLEFGYPDGDGNKHDGSWHRARAARRLARWLDNRMKLGFSEWNAPGYYNEDLPPLLNVADFCQDATIRAMALTVLDLIVFDLARFTVQGNFCATAGRVYLEHKRAAWDQSVGDCIELLFGTRGDVLAPNETTAIAFATSGYLEQVPEVLLGIGRDRTGVFQDASRVSGDLAPIDEDNPDDIVFWWGNGGYFTDQTYNATLTWARRWGLLNTGPFAALKFTGDNLWERFGLSLLGAGGSILLLSMSTILPFPLNVVFVAVSIPGVIRGFLDTFLAGVDLILEFFEDAWDTVLGWFGVDTDDDDAPRLSRPAVLETLKRLLIEFNKGSVLSTARLRTFRTPDVMLSSTIDHLPGEIAFQKQTCIAAIGQNAAVWTTKPFGEADTGAGLARGLGTLAEETPVQWAATMAFPWANRPYDGLVDVALPFLQGSAGLGGHDGPNWWTGTVSLPDVWQIDNAAVMLYRPSKDQRSLSKDVTHAWFPKHAFDEIRWEPAGDGVWVIGRCDRRFPPQNPRSPDDKPLSDDGRNRRMNEEKPGAPSGYVALYSANGLAWADGDFNDRELVAQGHENIFVTVVGDQAMFGSFQGFVDAIRGCGLTVNVDDMTASLRIPSGRGGGARHLEVSWGVGKVDGAPIDTVNWPRFENAYVSGRQAGRVEAHERGWRIALPSPGGGAPGLELIHDAEHPERRAFNRQVRARTSTKHPALDPRRDEISGGRKLRERLFKTK